MSLGAMAPSPGSATGSTLTPYNTRLLWPHESAPKRHLDRFSHFPNTTAKTLNASMLVNGTD